MVGGSNASTALALANAFVTVQGAAGAYGSASTVQVTSNSVLTLSNTAGTPSGFAGNSPPLPAGDLNDRLNTTAAVTLGGGSLELVGSANADVTQTIGSLTAVNGFNRINLVNTAGTSAALNVFGNLTLAPGSTLVVGGGSLGTTATTSPAGTRYVINGTTPAAVNGVIPGLYAATSSGGTATTFARNSATAGVGIVGLAAADYTPLATSTATTNAEVTAATTLAGSAAANALRTTANITVPAGQTLSVGAGGLLTSTNTTTVAGGTLAFTGPGPGLLMAGSTTTISSAITGTGGLVRSGTSSTTLSGDLSGLSGPLVNAGVVTLSLNTSTFAGPINILGGTVNTTANIGTGGTVTIGNPSTPAGTAGPATVLNVNTAAVPTFARNIVTVGGSGATPFTQTSAGNVLTVLSSGPQAFTGTVTLASPLAVNMTGTTSAATFSGVVSGAGGLEVTGSAGTVTLSNTSNSFTGGVRVNAGTLVTTAAGALGTGPVRFNSGAALRTDAAVTVGELQLIGSGVVNTNGNAVTAAGISGENSGATLSKSALTNGTLTINAAGNFPGSLVVGNQTAGAGGVTLAGGGALPLVTAVTVTANATLTLDNSTVYVDDRLNDRGTLTLTGAGAVVTYIPPTSGTVVAEQFGQLTAGGSGGVFNVAAGTSPTVLRLGNLVAVGNSITLRGADLGGTGPTNTRILIDNFAFNQAVLPNVFFEDTAGTGTSTAKAGYNTTLGVVRFVEVATTGASLNNFAPDNVPVTAAFTTNGNTTAATGASVFSLTLDVGSTLTLNGGNGPAAANGGTANNVLSLSGGLLTSQTGAKTIGVGTAVNPTIAFGNANAQVTTASDLTVAAGVTLSGNGGLTKLGANTLTLNGPYAITGPLTVSAGTLAFGPGLNPTVADLSGAGGLNLGTNTLTVNSANPTTFSGALAGTGGLVKAGPATFTLAPTTAPALAGGVTVAQGTLLVGNANAATTVLGGSLTLGAGTTGGTVDLNGFSPVGALSGITTGGTSTANAVTNSNTTTPATVNLNFAADSTVPVQFGGNVIVNKADATTLTLTGNATLPATTTGVFNVNAGTLLLTGTGNAGLGSGMSVSVAGGAVFRQTLTASGSTGPFGTIALAQGAEWQVTGASFADPSVNRIALTGGTVTFTGTNTGGTFIIFNGTTPGVVTSPSSVSARIVSTNLPDRIDSPSYQIAQGTVPANAADLQLGLRQNVNTVKSGPGTLELIGNTTASTGTWAVNAGTVRVTAGTGTGVVTVNSGGVLNGTGTVGAATTVNAGGFVQGGDPTAAGGTLALANNLTVTSQGGLRAVLTGAATASQLSLTGTAGVLNLNPGAGNKFVINLQVDPAFNPQLNTTYTYTLATLTGGSIQLNGVVVASGDIAAANYDVTGITLSGSRLFVESGTLLRIELTPVPEPVTVLAIGAAGLAAVGAVRRRRAAAAV